MSRVWGTGSSLRTCGTPAYLWSGYSYITQSFAQMHYRRYCLRVICRTVPGFVEYNSPDIPPPPYRMRCKMHLMALTQKCAIKYTVDGCCLRIKNHAGMQRVSQNIIPCEKFTRLTECAIKWKREVVFPWHFVQRLARSARCRPEQLYLSRRCGCGFVSPQSAHSSKLSKLTFPYSFFIVLF